MSNVSKKVTAPKKAPVAKKQQPVAAKLSTPEAFVGPMLPMLNSPVKGQPKGQLNNVTLTSNQTVTKVNLEAIKAEGIATKLANLQAAIAALTPKPTASAITSKRQPTMHVQREGGQPVQNGIRQPKPETKCGQSWGICDELLAKNGGKLLFTAKEVVAVGNERGINPNTSGSEFSMWRIFHYGRDIKVA